MRRFRFDWLSLSPRTRLIIIGGALIVLALIALAVVLTSDGSGRPGPRETAEETVAPTQTPDLAASALPTATIILDTPTPAFTPTLEPYEHTVQAGETLFFIIQLYGYRDDSVVPEILDLNNMASADGVFEGQNLIIPRQTPTLGPTATEIPAGDPGATPGSEGSDGGAPSGDTTDYSACSIENRCTSPDGAYWIHIVQPGETIAGLAFAYFSRVDQIIAANALNANNPVIFEGQEVRIPILVTSTPTLTPTGGPDSTATPTPTPPPPLLIAPAHDARIGRGQDVILQWASVRPLIGDQHYLIVITDTETGEAFRATTRSSTFRLPDSLQPGVGRSIAYTWYVTIVVGEADTSPVIGGQSETRTFTWGS